MEDEGFRIAGEQFERDLFRCWFDGISGPLDVFIPGGVDRILCIYSATNDPTCLFRLALFRSIAGAMRRRAAKGRDGYDVTTTVTWEGSNLVFETVEKDGAGTITTRETWALSEDGKILTKKRHSSGPRGDYDQKYVLEKQ